MEITNFLQIQRVRDKMGIRDKENFDSFLGNYIPVIGWTFFNDNENPNFIYNSDTWSGWKSDWHPIASDEIGNAIIIYSNSIYEAEHDVDAFEKKLITNDISILIKLLNGLKSYTSLSENESIDSLNKKLIKINSLKKISPKNLKYYFDIELDAIKISINEAKYRLTEDGQFRQAGLDLINSAFKELQKGGKYSDITLGRKDGEFIIFYSLENDDETLDEIKSIIAKHSGTYTIKYIKDE